MPVIQTKLPGVLIVEMKVFQDSRGFFLESYNARLFDELGITTLFVQDNHSSSVQGTLRGLHAQLRRPQAKLIRVVRGEIFDVAVDMRRGSPTFAKWFGEKLSAENFKQMFIPRGFLHGFCVLSESAEVEYKCDDFYDPEGEISVAWNDPQIGIAWPNASPLLSEKDRQARTLEQHKELLPEYS